MSKIWLRIAGTLTILLFHICLLLVIDGNTLLSSKMVSLTRQTTCVYININEYIYKNIKNMKIFMFHFYGSFAQIISNPPSLHHSHVGV